MATIVFPGDIIKTPKQMESNTIVLGPGTFALQNTIYSSKAGILSSQSQQIYLDSNQKQYIPASNEPIIATVISKHSENYRLDIAGPHSASLPLLAFENATRRNRPQLEIGAVVYCRITLANKDMEPEVTCVAPSGKSEGYGELKNGFMIKVSTKLARELLDSNNDIITGLAKAFPFEIVVGLNGRIWINSETRNQIIVACNIITNSDGMMKSKIPGMIKSQLKKMKQDSSI